MHFIVYIINKANLFFIFDCTHLGVLALTDDTEHRKDDSNQEAQLNADQSRGSRGDDPNDGIVPAGAPFRRDVAELPQRSPKADDDDTGKDTLLESVEERRKKEEDEQDDQGTDQTRYLMEGMKEKQT